MCFWECSLYLNFILFSFLEQLSLLMASKVLLLQFVSILLFKFRLFQEAMADEWMCYKNILCWEWSFKNIQNTTRPNNAFKSSPSRFNPILPLIHFWLLLKSRHFYWYNLLSPAKQNVIYYSLTINKLNDTKSAQSTIFPALVSVLIQ